MNNLLRSELVFLDVDVADVDELFSWLGAQLAPLGFIEPNWLQKITAREHRYPTGLMTSTAAIALPHVEEGVVQSYVAVVKPKKPITFMPMAGIGDPVEAQLVINLGSTKPEEQINLLQGFMNLFMDKNAARRLLKANTAHEVVAAITPFFK